MTRRKKPKFDAKEVDALMGALIKEWCDEFPYGETCKNCTSQPLCDSVHKAMEPELYERTVRTLEGFDAK